MNQSTVKAGNADGDIVTYAESLGYRNLMYQPQPIKDCLAKSFEALKASYKQGFNDGADSLIQSGQSVPKLYREEQVLEGVKAAELRATEQAKVRSAKRDHKFISEAIALLQRPEDPLNIEYAMKLLEDWQYELAALKDQEAA